jgi:hypothetical protein
MHVIEIEIGASVAPAGTSRVFERESTIQTEMDK